MRVTDIAIFAHNEERVIETLIADLGRQDLLVSPETCVRIHFLCNGCTDETVKVAESHVLGTETLAHCTTVKDFVEPGKARTWNRFVDELPEDSEYVIFLDADINLRDTRALGSLIEELEASDACAVTSRPVKDLASLHGKPLLRLAAMMIKREHRNGPIAGSLYAVKARYLRKVRLPVPCLVEDGFFSACLITGLFSHDANPNNVKASSKVRHYFVPPANLPSFFKHDVRLSVGRELNAALYSDLWAAKSLDERVALLRNFSSSEGIEQSILSHLDHPERSALKNKRRIRYAFGMPSERPWKRITRFPLRLAHAVYMSVVQARARQLFRQRRFNW